LRTSVGACYICCVRNQTTVTDVRIEEALAYRIYRCARLLRQHFHQLAVAQGIELSQEQWFILNRLVHEDGLAQGQLGDAVLDDRPNVARLVASLEARNLVRRDADASDGRKWVVRLTAEGRSLHDRFANLVPTARTATLKGVNKESLAAAMQVLAQLESNIERS
jgi:MarR family transcriptional regulator, transcriptional regulator for hemolysin